MALPRISRGIRKPRRPRELLELPAIDEDTLLQSVDTLYPDIAQRARSAVDVLREVRDFAIAEPDAFKADLRTKGRTPDTEIMLQAFGFKPEDIDELFPQRTAEEQAEILRTGDVAETEIANILLGQGIPYEQVVQVSGLVKGYLSPTGRSWSPIDEATDEVKQAWIPIFEEAWWLPTIEPAPTAPEERDPFWWVTAGPELLQDVPIFRDIGAWSLSPQGQAVQRVLGLVGIIGTLGFGTMQAATIGWNMFLRGYITRQATSLARARGVEIPKETMNNFVNTIMNDRVSRRFVGRQFVDSIFRRTPKGFQVTPEAVSRVEEELVALVRTQAGTIIPRATQTGALAFGGLPPQPGALTVAIWNTMTVAQRVASAGRAGLEATVGERTFETLTEAEKSAMAKVIPETAPDVVPPTELEARLQAELIRRQVEIPREVSFTVEEYATRQGIGVAEASQELADMAIKGEVEALGGVNYRTITPEAVPIVHVGTEPEGISIADEIGVRYEGIQEGIGDIPDTMMFTDVQQTGSTFTANTLEEAQTKLTSMREAFVEAEALEGLPPEEIATRMTEKPLKPQEEVQVEEIQQLVVIDGQPKLTLQQIDALTGFFADYINNPSTVNAWEITRELRRETRAGKAEELKARAQELVVKEGLGYEDAINRAMSETLSGKLPSLTSDYLDNMTTELRDALFGKVYHVLKDEPLEMASTITALTNALMGKPIPREPGVRGASAYTRLQRVFGDQPKVLAAIDKTASEEKPLKDVVEGIFHETGREPIPVDQEMAEYLRNLPTWGTQESARLDIPGSPSGKLTFDPSGKLGLEAGGEQLTLSVDEARAFRYELSEPRTPEDLAQRKLELELYLGTPPRPPTRYDPPIDDAFKELPLWPEPYKEVVVRVLKEIGMSPVDIGNFLRANKASFDFSFWRQQAPLIASHPVAFAYANIAAWNALWSQKAADASWARITIDPLYEIYTIGAEEGGDFLRPLVLEKGMGRYRGTEEFGFAKGSPRLIPRLTTKIPWVKISQRSFETGTNEHNWLIYKAYYRSMLRLSEEYATGQRTLKPGEVFDITKEMIDFSKMLANFTARGSLGKFSAAAPEIAGLFFAPRASIGRLLSVKDLLNANPRVRREAWKNAALFVAVFGGIILMGAYAGWWSVETDPRSAEYMSIRVGNTRIDPWGGFRQFLVFFTRAFTKTGVSSVTGAEYDADPINLLQTLIRGKASPLASVILDFWRGKNFIGEEVDVANKEQWAERVAPFSIWDIYEAYRDDPTIAMQSALPAILGAGVQTYTGGWEENFAKLGLPKYSENLVWGVPEPIYDTGDFWADTSSQFAGVDPATLTAQKGFPAYIRAIVEAREIKEHLTTLPNDKLVDINAFPSKGLTYVDYYEMWKERERIVASGDEDALKAFDSDERTRNAQLGNFSQRQLSLLGEYWTITDNEKQAEFLELHEDEIGTNIRKEYIRTRPGTNAELAIWQQHKVLTMEAYNQTLALAKKFDIPDNAIKGFLPPEEVVEVYFELSDSRRSDVLKSGTTKAISEMYLEYSKLYDAGTKGAHGRGEDFRRANPELQQWGEINLGWKPLEGRTTPTAPGIRAFEGLLR